MKSRKQLVFASLLVSLTVFSSNANAIEQSVIDDVYLDSREDILENNNVSFGYRLLSADSVLKNARIEQQLSHNKAIYENNSYHKTKVMSNFVYDIKKKNGVNAYVGAGIGVMHISSTDDNKDESATSPSYQVLTGMSYTSPNLPSFKFQLGYSYIDRVAGQEAGNDLHLKQDNLENEGNHSVSAIIKYTF